MRIETWRVTAKVVAFLTAVACVAAAGLAPAQAQPSRAVILSTTTSTQDSGLLDVLVPMFEKRTGYSVKTISVGTGQALALAARGEADVTLAHAPSLEKKYVADGKMQNRRLVMYNDFVIIGPAGDPANLGRGPDGHDDALATTRDHARCRVGEGIPVGQRGRRGDGLDSSAASTA